MRLGEKGWWKGAGLCLLVGACFSGEFVQGLPCQTDADCGPKLICVNELCGGPGDPALCGNGLVDIGEECDEEGDNCTPECRRPVCGDGYVGLGEGCDDGNTVDGDECSATCQLPGPPPMCGNGEVEAGEECDDGNTEDGDACTQVCSLPVCGDGFIGPGEECDDSNDIGTDECTPQCTLPVCGDGYVNLPEEACDDANTTDTDECTTVCTLSPEVPTLELSLAQVKQFKFQWEPVLGAERYELLERANEDAEFVKVGEIVDETSYSLTVPLHFRVNASYKLRACNEVRCVESAEVDVEGSLAEAVGYFKASNPDAEDLFGSSVALSADGMTMAVAAPEEDSGVIGINGDEDDYDPVMNSGAVYVFVRVGKTWAQQAYVKPSTIYENDRFGSSVALSADGHTMVIGCNAETVWVFTRIGESWSQQADLKASNADWGDRFGWAVALSGDGTVLAVGATGEGSLSNNQEDNDGFGAGAVYVFTREDDIWQQEAYLKASNPGGYDFFGEGLALSLDGSVLAVGAVDEDSIASGINGNQNDDSAESAGAVYIFSQDGGSWEQQSYVKASNPNEYDYFGRSVALSADGSILAVGAPGEDSNGNTDNNSISNSGAVYIYVQMGGEWAEPIYVKAPTPDPWDNFGGKVSLSADGTMLAIGAPYESSSAAGLGGDQGSNSVLGAGAVFVYTRDSESWQHEVYVKSPAAQAQQAFGTDLSMSGDGQVLAVGAPGEGSASSGIGGEQIDDSKPESGAGYVY